jgi:hypothetical protein
METSLLKNTTKLLFGTLTVSQTDFNSHKVQFTGADGQINHFTEIEGKGQFSVEPQNKP